MLGGADAEIKEKMDVQRLRHMETERLTERRSEVEKQRSPEAETAET